MKYIKLFEDKFSEFDEFDIEESDPNRKKTKVSFDPMILAYGFFNEWWENVATDSDKDCIEGIMTGGIDDGDDDGIGTFEDDGLDDGCWQKAISGLSDYINSTYKDKYTEEELNSIMSSMSFGPLHP